jgi:hypothetical protein
MNRKHSFDGLDLQDDFSGNQKIDTVSAMDSRALVVDGKLELALVRDAAKRKFVAETALISGFKKPRAQAAVYVDSSPNDVVRKVGRHTKLLRAEQRILRALCVSVVNSSN